LELLLARVFRALAADNGCSTLRGDREVTGCCCDTSNACNTIGYPDVVVPTPPARPEFPISCWTGIYVNGKALSKPGFQSCSGECASLTLVTTLQGQTHNATMYTCDPTSVCKSLAPATDLNKEFQTPGKPLLCYVGLNAPKAGVNVGAEVACDGMCSSLNAM
ncbi:ET module, partial [Ancylostoma duodenale]